MLRLLGPIPIKIFQKFPLISKLFNLIFHLLIVFFGISLSPIIEQFQSFPPLVFIAINPLLLTVLFIPGTNLNIKLFDEMSSSICPKNFFFSKIHLIHFHFQELI